MELLLASNRNAQPIGKVDLAAVGVLHTIAAAGKELAWKLVELGVVPPLLALIERRTTAGAVGAAEERALRYAADVLGCLADDYGEMQTVVSQAGSVPCLARLLGHSSADVQRSAANALRCGLCDCPAAQAAFAEAAAAPAVVRLLHSQNQQVQQQAAGVLGNAACDCAASSAAILAAGAVPTLVHLLCTPCHPAHEWAATTVQNLCAMQPAVAVPAFMQAEGGLGALVQLAEGSGDEHVRAAASRALDAIARALQTASQWQGSGSSTGRSSVEAAPAAVEGAAHPPRTCAAPGCGATRGLKRCGGCGTVRYCSVECSRAHWRAHKAECRRVQAERAAAPAERGDEAPSA